MAELRLSGDGTYQRCSSRFLSNSGRTGSHWRCDCLPAQALFSKASEEEYLSPFAFAMYASSETDLPLARTGDCSLLGVARSHSVVCHAAQASFSKARDPGSFCVRLAALQAGPSSETVRCFTHEDFRAAR